MPIPPLPPSPPSASGAPASEVDPKTAEEPAPAIQAYGSANDHSGAHRSVVLFYKYFLSGSCCADATDAAGLFRAHAGHYVPLLCEQQRRLCGSLGMRGRVLLSGEGVNGTLSAPDDGVLKEYVDAMTGFDLIKELGPPPPSTVPEAAPSSPVASGEMENRRSRLFANVDWKTSVVDDVTAALAREPFPDLKISAVHEIVSTGQNISLEDISEYGGTHLSPEEFHATLLGRAKSNNAEGDGSSGEKKDIVLIDVRNTFEHAVGHFVNPTANNEAAINPHMTNFASFDTKFCAQNADEFRGKKVLMYCTGGIRCEKASAMLRKRGVDDVSQLSGGIHRYLEKYGNSGLFKGKNFVFDQRVAIAPGPLPAPGATDSLSTSDAAEEICMPEVASNSSDECHSSSNSGQQEQSSNVVGKCIVCGVAYDELLGSILCTVCRDLVLVCHLCQAKQREYHCDRHSEWKDCYFTFLDIFDKSELEQQERRLVEIREALVPPSDHKNVRRTLMRQIDKVRDRIEDLRAGKVTVDRKAPRRCRTCGETEDVCDGLCWGFWKRSVSEEAGMATSNLRGAKRQHGQEDINSESNIHCSEMMPIHIGDTVRPGPHWNDLRLGSKTLPDRKTTLKIGRVVDIKSWGSGGTNDCVSVLWTYTVCGETANASVASPKIYRWGVLAKNGQRMYDVEKVVCQT